MADTVWFEREMEEAEEYDACSRIFDVTCTVCCCVSRTDSR